MLEGQTEYLTLNGCGLSVLGLADLVHKLFIKAKMGKTCRRLWRSGARYLKQGKESRNDDRNAVVYNSCVLLPQDSSPANSTSVLTQSLEFLSSC